MDTLRYVEDTHQYFLGEKELPSVSKILKFGDPAAHQFAQDEAAAERGKAVHRTIYLYINGRLDDSSIHPTIAPYFDAFLRFEIEIARMQGVRFSYYKNLCETPAYHPQALYAGTPDILVRLGNQNVLIDIKTGTLPSWAAQQTAAYRYFPSIYALKPARWAVRLKGDGKYQIGFFHNHAGDLVGFLKHLQKYKGGNIHGNSTGIH